MATNDEKVMRAFNRAYLLVDLARPKPCMLCGEPKTIRMTLRTRALAGMGNRRGETLQPREEVVYVCDPCAPLMSEAWKQALEAFQEEI